MAVPVAGLNGERLRSRLLTCLSRMVTKSRHR